MVSLLNILFILLHFLPSFVVPFGGGSVLAVWWKERKSSLVLEVLVGFLAAIGVWVLSANALFPFLGPASPWLGALGFGAFGIWWWKWRACHPFVRVLVGTLALACLLDLFQLSLLFLAS